MRYKQWGYAVLAIWAAVNMIGIAYGADEYVTDPSHTSVGFIVRHLGIYKVGGEFTDFAGTIMYDEDDMTQSSLHGIIKTASLNTYNAKRDEELRGEKFFNVEKFPEITFASERVEYNADGHQLIGDLSILGITRKIAIPFEITGKVVHRGKTLLGFEAHVRINRQDFGMRYSEVMDTGGLIVGNTVDIELSGRAIKKEY